MPDLSGLPALDVLIGMAFMFFVLATVVASVNEIVQTMLNARARTLSRGIATLLKDEKAAKKFFADPRIERLAKPAGFIRRFASSKLAFVAKRRRPSYIPARAFALTLLETATPDGSTPMGAELLGEAQARTARLGLDAQGALEAKRAELERAFDEVMDRASGWYKRYVQWWLLGLALVVAIGLNVNAFTVAERLWKDDALRAAVVGQAQQSLDEDQPQAGRPATPKAVADQIDEIGQLKLPVGWDEANTKGEFPGRLAGWLVSAAAIALGAPFWFDVLGKLARVRGSGNREGTAKNDRAAEDRDDPSRARSVS